MEEDNTVELGQLLFEGRKLKRGQRVLVDGIELDLSSPEGILFLTKTLDGLSSIKNSCETGSSTRHILAQACHRLKRILEANSPTLDP